MAFDHSNLIKNSTHVYTTSGDKHQFESSQWEGIIDSNINSIIMPVNKDGIALTTQTNLITHTFSDNTGTYSCYRIKMNVKDIDKALVSCKKDEATVTYYATTQYGDCTYTDYRYYKPDDSKKYIFKLQLTFYMYIDQSDAILSTTDFVPMETTNPINFYSLGAMPYAGTDLTIDISTISNTSGVKPKIDDFAIIVNNDIRSTTTVYGRNFKLYVIKQYKNTGSNYRWNYSGTEGQFLTLNVVQSS